MEATATVSLGDVFAFTATPAAPFGLQPFLLDFHAVYFAAPVTSSDAFFLLVIAASVASSSAPQRRAGPNTRSVTPTPGSDGSTGTAATPPPTASFTPTPTPTRTSPCSDMGLHRLQPFYTRRNPNLTGRYQPSTAACAAAAGAGTATPRPFGDARKSACRIEGLEVVAPSRSGAYAICYRQGGVWHALPQPLIVHGPMDAEPLRMGSRQPYPSPTPGDPFLLHVTGFTLSAADRLALVPDAGACPGGAEGDAPAAPRRWAAERYTGFTALDLNVSQALAAGPWSLCYRFGPWGPLRWERLVSFVIAAGAAASPKDSAPLIPSASPRTVPAGPVTGAAAVDLFSPAVSIPLIAGCTCGALLLCLALGWRRAARRRRKSQPVEVVLEEEEPADEAKTSLDLLNALQKGMADLGDVLPLVQSPSPPIEPVLGTVASGPSQVPPEGATAGAVADGGRAPDAPGPSLLQQPPAIAETRRTEPASEAEAVHSGMQSGARGIPEATAAPAPRRARPPQLMPVEDPVTSPGSSGSPLSVTSRHRAPPSAQRPTSHRDGSVAMPPPPSSRALLDTGPALDGRSAAQSPAAGAVPPNPLRRPAPRNPLGRCPEVQSVDVTSDAPTPASPVTLAIGDVGIGIVRRVPDRPMSPQSLTLFSSAAPTPQSPGAPSPVHRESDASSQQQSLDPGDHAPPPALSAGDVDIGIPQRTRHSAAQRMPSEGPVPVHSASALPSPSGRTASAAPPDQAAPVLRDLGPIPRAGDDSSASHGPPSPAPMESPGAAGRPPTSAEESVPPHTPDTRRVEQDALRCAAADSPAAACPPPQSPAGDALASSGSLSPRSLATPTSRPDGSPLHRGVPTPPSAEARAGTPLPPSPTTAPDGPVSALSPAGAVLPAGAVSDPQRAPVWLEEDPQVPAQPHFASPAVASSLPSAEPPVDSGDIGIPRRRRRVRARAQQELSEELKQTQSAPQLGGKSLCPASRPRGRGSVAPAHSDLKRSGSLAWATDARGTARGISLDVSALLARSEERGAAAPPDLPHRSPVPAPVPVHQATLPGTPTAQLRLQSEGAAADGPSRDGPLPLLPIEPAARPGSTGRPLSATRPHSRLESPAEGSVLRNPLNCARAAPDAAAPDGGLPHRERGEPQAASSHDTPPLAPRPRRARPPQLMPVEDPVTSPGSSGSPLSATSRHRAPPSAQRPASRRDGSIFQDDLPRPPSTEAMAMSPPLRRPSSRAALDSGPAPDGRPASQTPAGAVPPPPPLGRAPGDTDPAPDGPMSAPSPAGAVPPAEPQRAPVWLQDPQAPSQLRSVGVSSAATASLPPGEPPVDSGDIGIPRRPRRARARAQQELNEELKHCHSAPQFGALRISGRPAPRAVSIASSSSTELKVSPVRAADDRSSTASYASSTADVPSSRTRTRNPQPLHAASEDPVPWATTSRGAEAVLTGAAREGPPLQSSRASPISTAPARGSFAATSPQPPFPQTPSTPGAPSSDDPLVDGCMSAPSPAGAVPPARAVSEPQHAPVWLEAPQAPAQPRSVGVSSAVPCSPPPAASPLMRTDAAVGPAAPAALASAQSPVVDPVAPAPVRTAAEPRQVYVAPARLEDPRTPLLLQPLDPEGVPLGVTGDVPSPLPTTAAPVELRIPRRSRRARAPAQKPVVEEPVVAPVAQPPRPVYDVAARAAPPAPPTAAPRPRSEGRAAPASSADLGTKPPGALAWVNAGAPTRTASDVPGPPPGSSARPHIETSASDGASPAGAGPPPMPWATLPGPQTGLGAAAGGRPARPLPVHEPLAPRPLSRTAPSPETAASAPSAAPRAPVDQGTEAPAVGAVPPALPPHVAPEARQVYVAPASLDDPVAVPEPQTLYVTPAALVRTQGPRPRRGPQGPGGSPPGTPRQRVRAEPETLVPRRTRHMSHAVVNARPDRRTSTAATAAPPDTLQGVAGVGPVEGSRDRTANIPGPQSHPVSTGLWLEDIDLDASLKQQPLDLVDDDVDTGIPRRIPRAHAVAEQPTEAHRDAAAPVVHGGGASPGQDSESLTQGAVAWGGSSGPRPQPRGFLADSAGHEAVKARGVRPAGQRRVRHMAWGAEEEGISPSESSMAVAAQGLLLRFLV